jgi:hypothetical protein
MEVAPLIDWDKHIVVVKKSCLFASPLLHGHSKAILPCIMSSLARVLKKKLLQKKK